MSLRPRRALLGLATTIAALAVVPATALAANATLTVTPSDLTAGGSPSLATDIKFAPAATGDTPQSMEIDLAPGLLSNLNANPSCLTGAPQFTDPCLIGSGTIATVLNGSAPLTVTGNLYLVAPPDPTDVAGIDMHITSPAPLDAVIGVQLDPSNASLKLSSTLPNTVTLGTTSLPLQITEIQTTFNATVNGQPFNRLPTSCGAATSSLSVTYFSGATGSANNSFTPTPCTSLPYSPNLTAAVTADPTNGGAEVKMDVTQAANEAATKAMTVTFPSGLKPNVAALASCVTGTACTVGTASATSPLLPGTLNGTVTLGGSISAPTLSIAFPPPFGLTLTGAVNLANGSVTFSNVPDIPLSDLSLDITGVNGQRAFTTDCKSASVTGSFTGQGGQTETANAPITLSGSCPPPSTGGGTPPGGGGTPPTGGGTPPSGTKPSPTKGSPKPKKHAVTKASGSIHGLASGHPRLKFHVTAAKGTKIHAVAIGLPHGLKFARSAFASQSRCAHKHSKCKPATHATGLHISGGHAKSVVMKNGRLVITLRTAVRSLSITTSGSLEVESPALETKVKHHKAGTLRFTIKVTYANHTSRTLTLRLKA